MSGKQGFEDQSVASSSEQREKLHGFVLKPLAELIEENGGIVSFLGRHNQNLRLVLDKSNNPLFGTTGDRIRRRIQQKVYRWQDLNTKGTYESGVLNGLGVTSFANRFKKETPNKNKKQQKKSPKLLLLHDRRPCYLQIQIQNHHPLIEALRFL